MKLTPLLRRVGHAVALGVTIALWCWTLWDTVIFYVASPSSLLSVAKITAAILVGLGALAVIVPKKRRGAALRGFQFALMIFFGAMFVVTAPLFAWIGLRGGFTWEIIGFPAVMAGMCFACYRDWRA